MQISQRNQRLKTCGTITHSRPTKVPVSLSPH